MSNVGPLEVGYFIHLEYKAKVSPADHMPSHHARAHAHTHTRGALRPPTHAGRAAAAHIWWYVSLFTYATVRAHVRAYVYGDNVQSKPSMT